MPQLPDLTFPAGRRGTFPCVKLAEALSAITLVAVVTLTSGCGGDDARPSVSSSAADPASTQAESATDSESTTETAAATVECGGVDLQTIEESAGLSGLDVVSVSTVGCDLAGDDPSVMLTFTWYRGSPIGRERMLVEQSSATVEDAFGYIEGAVGFVSSVIDPSAGFNACEIAVESGSSDDYYLWSANVEDSSQDSCGIVTALMEQTRASIGIAGLSTGPSSTVDQYPNATKECALLDDAVAQSTGIEVGELALTFAGAVCRWRTADNAVVVTRQWFESGNLQNEREVAAAGAYTVEDREIAGVASIVVTPDGSPGTCGVLSEAAGVVGWWVSVTDGGDACQQASALIEQALAP